MQTLLNPLRLFHPIISIQIDDSAIASRAENLVQLHYTTLAVTLAIECSVGHVDTPNRSKQHAFSFASAHLLLVTVHL